MSEKILKALMQLFAIIARPESSEKDRRSVVEAFLRRELNEDLVQEYLRSFDQFYHESQEKQKKGVLKKRQSAVSVRILKITNQINFSLTQNQKIIVLVQLFEFCKSDGTEVSEEELEFIRAVAGSFYVREDDFELISAFVLNDFREMPDSPHILLIDNKKEAPGESILHIRNDNIKGQVWVLEVASANMHFMRFTDIDELYMNGQLVQEDKVYPFNPGSSIRDPKYTPLYYSDIASRFRREVLQASRVVYEVRDIDYKFRTGDPGIHKMSFEEESGRLVGIMGSSGAGKSTLLNVLNGINKPNNGEVKVNGINIHSDSEKAEGLIGYVSQDDLLIEELTVYQNLYYNAKLCFDNLTEEEIHKKVADTLRNLGLLEIKDMKVGSPLNKKISGGQRKRLNIALELIREPPVLFLDEPTSGLSSRDSENILDLLKELALKGKLLFVVIHQPSSDIFKMFDRLIILDTGGYIIYDGDPIESIIYFKRRTHQANYNESECHACGNVNPEQVFNIVESKVLDEYGKATNVRKISPREWHQYYREHIFNKERKLDPGHGLPKVDFKIPDRFKQFVVFIKRDILAKLSDSQYLIVTLLEAPVLAFALAFLIKYFDESASNAKYTLLENSNLPVYLFMSVIVAIFMGLTVSAEEIIKDRKILKREAFLNLSWNSYLMSKVSVQLLISAIQAFAFVLVGNGITEIRGMWFEYWLVLFSCWASANLLGLLISDSFKTVVTIYMLIPFLVIPQIILSGVIVKFEKLNPNISSPSTIPFYGEMIVARWGYEALAVKQFKDNAYEKQFYEYDRLMSIANYKKIYWYNDLKQRISELEEGVSRKQYDEEFKKDLLVLRNEIAKEIKAVPLLEFNYLDQLLPERVNSDAISAALRYIEILNQSYKNLYNKNFNEKDRIITEAMDRDPEAFIELKEKHFNKSLEEFVTNEKEEKRIIEFKGELIQKMDPIYKDPEHPFLKAHFYAPRKQIFGTYVDTLWVNIIFIWFWTIVTYLALYFRVLKRILDSFEASSERKKARS
jgi:ABC-type multidrug transport system ATPase subunit